MSGRGATARRAGWSALALSLALASAPLAAAQGGSAHGPATPDEAGAPQVERVFVPEAGLDRVLRRHERGVIVSEAELARLIAAAAARPEAPEAALLPSPLELSIERLSVSGRVDDGVARLIVEADVALVGPPAAIAEVARSPWLRLPLPLAGEGLRAIWLGPANAAARAPARVILSRAGPEVLLPAPAPGERSRRQVSWELATPVVHGEERGSGSLRLRVPAAASGRLSLDVPGDLEVLVPEPTPIQLSRGRVPGQQSARAEGELLAWTDGTRTEDGAVRTALGAAFGGADAAPHTIELSWRPRRALEEVAPYTIADVRSLYLVRRGVVLLAADVNLEVYRAPRTRVELALPAGFVIRRLTTDQGELTYLQRGERVEVRLAAPRRGAVRLVLEAERVSSEMGGDAAGADEALVLRPLLLPGVDRVAGTLGVAAGPEAVCSFDAVSGLERADLSALSLAAPLEDAARTGALLRAYRWDGRDASLRMRTRPLEPRVELTLKGALSVRERELEGIVVFAWRVQVGRAFQTVAELPAGYELERSVVRDGQGAIPAHELDVREVVGAGGGPAHSRITIDLERGLEPGQELLLTCEVTRFLPDGLTAGQTGVAGADAASAGALELPRFTGSPAHAVRGHLGFAPDAGLRLSGEGLAGLLAVPAEELPRAGLAVPGLVLGYRIDRGDYAGRLLVTREETRISAELLTRHDVRERVIHTDAHLALQVDGAPLRELELLLPAGTGRLARVEAPGLLEDRELLGLAEDGRERWRLAFERPPLGAVNLRVRLSTKLVAEPSAGGEVAGDPSSTGPSSTDPTSTGLTSAELPRVSLAGAFRERGTVAIHSSDATELSVEATALRTIEVTEVPSLGGPRVGATTEALADADERPLFAFRHVGPSYGLTVRARRHPTAPVLTAVAEALILETSAGSDGTARHHARFRVKNLDNQFFTLRLPEGATLWSVVVDGEGVKPAEQDGLRVIPIPAAGAKGPDQATEVHCVFTTRGPRWGARPDLDAAAGLVAPALFVSTTADEPIPVLHTTWKVSLPDDYRVLAYEGNLDGPPVTRARPLAVSAWERRAGWSRLGVVAIVGLLVAVSARAQGGLLWLLAAALNLLAGARARGRALLRGTLEGTRRGVAGADDALTSPGASGCARVVKIGIGLGLLGLIALAVMVLVMEPPSASRIRAIGTVSSEKAKGDAGRERTGYGSPKLDSPTTGDRYFLTRQGVVFDDSESAGGPVPVGRASAEPAPSAPEAPARGRAGGAFAFEPESESAPADDPYADAPAAEPPPPPAAKPKRVRDLKELQKRSEPYREGDKDGSKQLDEEALNDVLGGGTKQGYAFEGKEEAAKELDESFQIDGEAAGVRGRAGKKRAAGFADGSAEGIDDYDLSAGGEGRARFNGRSGRSAGNGGMIQLEEEVEVSTDIPKGTDLKVVGGLAAGGQVGLRSLVLDLPGVGRELTFTRPGGVAAMDLRLGHEPALLAAAGVLALLAFLAGLLLPRTGRLAYPGLLLLALTALSAYPLLAPTTALTPLLNAAAFGLLASAPAAALLALARTWRGRPLDQLTQALATARAQSTEASR